MAALHDGTIFDIRRCEILPNSDLRRVTVAHHCLPQPGSQWVISPSMPQVCAYEDTAGAQTARSRKSVLLFGPDELRKRFNEESRTVNTSGMPAILRDLVKKGDYSLAQAQNLVMKNEVPLGVPVEVWTEWRGDPTRDRTWEDHRTGLPCRAEIRSGPRSLASMLNNISPTNSVLLNPNAAVRQAFVVLVVRATRLTAAQADAYILSGGVVTVISYEGQGWARVALATPTTSTHTEGNSTTSNKNSVPRDRWDKWCSEEINAGRTLMVQLWHKSSNSEDADLRHPSTNGASFTGGANDVDEDAKTDVARSDSGNNAKWAWQQVLEVPLTTTVKALKEDLLSTSLAPASTVRGDEEFASTERSEDHNDDDDKVIASQRVRLVYAGRPLIACRVSTGGLNEQGKVNSAELEATLTLGDLLLDEVERRVASGHAHGHDSSAVCHLCGLEVASVTSLKWHLSKCLQNWQAEQRRAYPHQPELRRQPPRKPALPRVPYSTGPLLHAWNRQAALIFLLEATQRCSGCRRNFVDAHTLTNHMARCCPQHIPPEVPSTPHEMRLERLPFDSIPDVERKEREDDIDALFVAASSTTASVARTTAATPNNVDDMASCLFTPAQSQVLVNDEDDLSVADGFDGTMSNANQLPPFPQELPSHAPWSPSDQSLLPPMPPMMPSPSSSMPTSTVSAQQGSTHESSNAVANDKLPSRSLAVVRCYICDRLTGLSSVAWHHKRCTQSFHARNNGPSVPPILRRALAEPPSVPLPNYITALNGARSDEEDSEEVESRENNSGNDSEVLATQIAAYNTAARRIYHNEVRFHCPACGEGIDDNDDAVDYEHHNEYEYDNWGDPVENNNLELSKLYSIGLGVGVQQHLYVCCPDVLVQAQEQVLDMKAHRGLKEQSYGRGNERDSFDGGGPLRGWLCVGCGRHFGRAGYGWHLAACRRRWCAEAKAVGTDHHAEYTRRGNYAVRFSFALGGIDRGKKVVSSREDVADKAPPALHAARLLLQSHGQTQLAALLASAWTNQAIPPWGPREGSWLQSASEVAAATSLSERDLHDAEARDEATAREAASSQPGALALVGLRQVTISGLWLFHPSSNRRISLLDLFQQRRIAAATSAATGHAATTLGYTICSTLQDGEGDKVHEFADSIDYNDNNNEPVIAETLALALKYLDFSKVTEELQLEVSISVANLRSLDAARAVRSLLLPVTVTTSAADSASATANASPSLDSYTSRIGKDDSSSNTIESGSSVDADLSVGPVLGNPSLLRFLGAPCRLTLSPPTVPSGSLLDHSSTHSAMGESRGEGEGDVKVDDEEAEVEEDEEDGNSTNNQTLLEHLIPADTILANTATATEGAQSSASKQPPKAIRILRLPPPPPSGAPFNLNPLQAWRYMHKWARPSWAWRGNENMVADVSSRSRSSSGTAAGNDTDALEKLGSEFDVDEANVVLLPQFVRELIAAEERWFNLKAETTRVLYVLPRCPRCECVVASVDDETSTLNSSGLHSYARKEAEASSNLVATGAAAFRSIDEIEAAASKDLANAEEELRIARSRGSVFKSESALRDHMATCCREVLAVESALHALRQEALLAPGGGAATQSSTSNNLVAAQGIVCYLCGRLTPSSGSFGWHLRACVTRWQVAEFAKPPNQRRPLPKLPRHVKLPGPKPKLLLASTSSTLSSSTAAAARNPRQPLLPKGSSESRAAAFAAAMSKWQAQLQAYNEAALTLSSELIGLHCERCVDNYESLNRKRANAEAIRATARATISAAETASAAAGSSASVGSDEVDPEFLTTSVPEVGNVYADLARAESELLELDASLSKITRSFKTCKLLLQHMDKCCPQDIPQHSDADVRSALEALKNPFDLMVLIAETRDARRKRHTIAHERIASRVSAGIGYATTTHTVAGPASLPTEGTAAKFRAALKNNTNGTEAEEVEWTSLQRRIPLICYLCSDPSASLAGLDFHRRACLRQWDSRERLERPPHRRRLFGWRKSDPDTQFPGEKYGTATFFWDVPSTPSGGDLTSLLDGRRRASDPSVSPVALLREPKRRLLPGPVPAPPRAPLPPYPPADLAVLKRFNNSNGRNSNSSSSNSRVSSSKNGTTTSEWAGDAAYNAAAEVYNAEARHIFQDWTQWSCPSWRPVIIRFGPSTIQRMVDAFLDAKLRNSTSTEGADPGSAVLQAIGLEVQEVGNGGTRLVVEAFPNRSYSSDDLEVDDPDVEDESSDQGKHAVKPNDALWTISVLLPRKDKTTTKDRSSRSIAAKTALGVPNTDTAAVAPSTQSSGTTLNQPSSSLSASSTDSKNAPIREKQTWSTRRIYADTPSSAGLLLADAALECCDVILNQEEASGSGECEDGSDSGALAAAAEKPDYEPPSQRVVVGAHAKLAIVLRRGCSMRFATEKLLNRHLNGIASSTAAANKGCDRSGAIVAGRALLAQDHPPDPNRDQPPNPDAFKGTVCFICNQRVLYMGSLARHAAKCFVAADALQTADRPALYRDPPPKPPEHVYGRAPRTVTVWKDVKRRNRRRRRRRRSTSSTGVAEDASLGAPLEEDSDPLVRRTENDDSDADNAIDNFNNNNDADEDTVEEVAARSQEMVSVRQDCTLRARIARYKAGHTIGPSTVMEWKYDVKFAFFAAFHADQPADAESLQRSFAGVVLEPVKLRGAGASSQATFSGESASTTNEATGDGDGDDDDEDGDDDLVDDEKGTKDATVVLRVVRCQGIGRGEGSDGRSKPSTLPLVVGDQIMVCWHGASSSSSSTSSTNQKSPLVGPDGRTDLDACSAFLAVPWGDAEVAGACPWSQALGALQPKNPRAELPSQCQYTTADNDDGNTAAAFVPYSVRLRRPLKAPLDRQRDLCPAMTFALREWDRRCAALFIARHPRCGKRQVLTRTLRADQLNDSCNNGGSGQLSLVLTPLGCPEVQYRVEDDEGDLFPGDELTLYGPPGAPELTLSLAHGCLPSALLQNLRRVCAQSPTNEVTLHFVRRLLRPAYRPGIGAGLQWCEKLPKIPDDMTPAELRNTLARMRSGGIEEATEDGPRVVLRDRLESLLKGGCGRSFATQSAAFKHMRHCCPNILDPYAFEEPNPVKAASKDLAFHGDRGLGGVYVEQTQWPYGEPGWVCYLCAKRTRTLDSFKFHLLSCARAWDNYELTKHSSRWKPPPKAPCEVGKIPTEYGAELQAYNAKATAIHMSVQAQCAECGKTFKDEPSLDNHMASCCPQRLFQMTSKMGADRDAIGVDRTVPCYVCGRRVANYQSVPKHIASCLRRWYNREKEKPQPHLRLPPPAPPALPPPTTRRDVPAYRAQAQAVFENSLPRCNLRARYSVRCTIDLLKDLRGSAPFDDDSDSSSSSSSSSDDSYGGVGRTKKLGASSIGNTRKMKKTQASGFRGRLLNLEAPAASASHASAATAMAEASAPSARATATTTSSAMMMATITKRVPLEVARKHGLKRGDLLVAVTGPSSEPTDMNLLYGTTNDQGGIQAILARIEASALAIEHDPTARGEVWFERRCGMSFAEEDTMLKHQAKCKVDLVAGLKAGQDAASAATTKKVDDDVVKEGDGVFGVTSISNDNSARRKTRSGQPTVIGRAAAQLYRQHPAFEPTTTTTTTSSSVAGGGAGANNGSKRGTQKTQQSSNSFEPSLHRRVPVFGDTNNRFAPGARRRRDEDARVAAENAQFAARLDKVNSTLPKPAATAASAALSTRTKTPKTMTKSTTANAIPKGGTARIKSKREAEMWKESKRVQEENERLGKALRFLYGRKEAVKSAYGGVVGNAVRVARYYEGYGSLHPGTTPAPQTDQWEARTRIYTHRPNSTADAADRSSSTMLASSAARSRSNDSKAPSNGNRGLLSSSSTMAVPKTLGVAQCAGCAKRAYSSGGGGSSGRGSGLRRCKRVELPDLLAWTEAKGLFGDRCRLAAKLLGLNPKGGGGEGGGNKDNKLASFGGGCCRALDQSPSETPATADDVPWYCDDACALAGWLSHRRVCFHSPKLTGHGGLDPNATDPWVLLGSKFKGGVVGATRRSLQPSSATVAYPSGQTESNVPLDRLVPYDRINTNSITAATTAAATTTSAVAADVPPSDSRTLAVMTADDPAPPNEHAWIVPATRARLLKVSANGTERRVPVEIVSVVQKPGVKDLVAAIGSMVLQDPLLLAAVGEGERAEKLPVVEEEGLRCYYCYDEVYADATYRDHIAVCAARWRRMEARKPLAQQRPEPQAPFSMARPSDVHDQPAVAAWAQAVKAVMPTDDGSNPNGGGFLGRSEAAEERAGATAQKQQLDYALKDMDNKVVNDILALESLQKRLAWEKTGGLPASSLPPPRTAPQGSDNPHGVPSHATSTHAAWANAHAAAETRRTIGWKP